MSLFYIKYGCSECHETLIVEAESFERADDLRKVPHKMFIIHMIVIISAKKIMSCMKKKA